jgi:hypothetical protein
MALRILTPTACIALTLLAGGAHAQQPAFPTKPLKIAVPASAGSVNLHQSRVSVQHDPSIGAGHG